MFRSAVIPWAASSLFDHLSMRFRSAAILWAESSLLNHLSISFSSVLILWAVSSLLDYLSISFRSAVILGAVSSLFDHLNISFRLSWHCFTTDHHYIMFCYCPQMIDCPASSALTVLGFGVISDSYKDWCATEAQVKKSSNRDRTNGLLLCKFRLFSFSKKNSKTAPF